MSSKLLPRKRGADPCDLIHIWGVYVDLYFYPKNVRIKIEKRGEQMIATAIALQDATKESVMNKITLGMAGNMYQLRDTSTDEEFQDMLFQYSAHLSALTATLVLEAVLTKSQLDEMMDTIKEMENFGKDITNE